MYIKYFISLFAFGMFMVSGANAATITYLTNGGSLSGSVTIGSIQGSYNLGPGYREGSIYPSGSDHMLFTYYGGEVELEYSGTLNSTGFNLNANLLSFNLSTDTIAHEIEARAFLSFTVDTEVNAIVTGNTAVFYDINPDGLSEYYWTESFDGYLTGTHELALTPGTIYHASLSTGNSGFLNSVSLELVAPLPGAVWLFGSGLIGLIGLSRRNRT